MIRRPPSIAAFLRDEDGATLVEFALVISLFLLIFFGLLDFGRLAYHLVTAERAMQSAARIAAVRPAACPGVPNTISRNPAAPAEADYGTSCGAAGGPYCLAPNDGDPIECEGDATNPTAAEVWAQVRYALPGTATIDNLCFSYTYNDRMGFLGGPYVPVVTVRLQNVSFQFVTPLSALAGLAVPTPDITECDPTPKPLPVECQTGQCITLPSMSVSLPGEDLAQGGNG